MGNKNISIEIKRMFMAEAKMDEFAFVLIAGLIIIIVMLLMWGVPTETQIPVVTPVSQSLAINKGSSEKFILNVNVTSQKVTLTPKGTIADWISLSNNDFESSGLSSVEVTVRVPYGTEERVYYGSVEVESAEGGKVVVPLTITVTTESTTQPTEISNSHYIGDFTVTSVSGSETIKTVNNVEVRKSLNEDKGVTFSGGIEKDMSMVTDGYLIIDILYTNNEGNLIVKLNNEVILDSKVLPGETKIPIDKGLLGSYNVIEISTSCPGWKFWSSSIYKIDKIEFGIDVFGNMEKKETFEVSRDEIINFNVGRVEFSINSYQGDGRLTVKINNHKIFEDKRQGNIVLNFNYVDVGLVRGENTISFSTDTGTTYDIGNAQITIIHNQS
jgi:hypothetical protein